MNKVAVVGYGRMNPVTKGHRHLAKLLNEEAHKRGGDPILYLSRSYDGLRSDRAGRTIKNPLPYDDKLIYVRDALGDLVDVRHSPHPSVFTILGELNQEGYSKLIIMGDEAFAARPFKKYNGTAYDFNSVETLVAGVRDENSEKFIESVSATKARAAVEAGDFELFRELAGTRKLTVKLWKQLRTELIA